MKFAFLWSPSLFSSSEANKGDDKILMGMYRNVEGNGREEERKWDGKRRKKKGTQQKRGKYKKSKAIRM